MIIESLDRPKPEANLKEDMTAVFGCVPDQIASSPDEINDNTRAYVGSLVHYDNNGEIIPIFKKIGHLEYIYTSFPQGRIRIEAITIGGKTSKELQRELKKQKVTIPSYASDMLESSDFTTLKNPQELITVRLKIQDLGLSGILSTDQVYARAKELGLTLCPPEAGPYLRLRDTNQPLGDRYWIGMKPITDRRRYSNIFQLVRRWDGLHLRDDNVRPMYPKYGWKPKDEIVFSLSK